MLCITVLLSHNLLKRVIKILKNMRTKIAITGLPESNKTLLGKALSIVTGIPFIRNKTIYEWHKTFNISCFGNFEWKDMLLIATCSFFERLEVEKSFDTFISDGTSLNELMCLKSNFACENHNRVNELVSSFENASISYAVQQYDFVVHAKHDSIYDDYYTHLYRKYNIPYKVYNTTFLENTLEEIVSDLYLPVVYEVNSSVYEAKNNLFLKNNLLTIK